MRLLVLHALFTLAASSSCILVLDFEDGGPQGTAGADEGGADTGGTNAGGGGGGGGGATPGGEWVTALSATTFSDSASVDSRVSVKSVAVSGDTTWIGGYFFGKELKLRDDDGTESTILTSPTGVTTFVVALDGDGKLKKAIPIAGSAEPAEFPFDEWLGTQLDVDASGNVYVLSSYRAGVTLFDEADPVDGSPLSWDLLLLKLDSEGEVQWASRCAAQQAIVPGFEVGASLSARYADVLVISDTQIAFATTVEPSTDITCEVLTGDADPCVLPPQLEQAGLIGTLAPDGTCDGGALQLKSHLPGPMPQQQVPVWFDGMALDTAGEVLLSGRVSTGGGILEPWSSTVQADTPVAFTGSFALDGGGRVIPPRLFNSDSRPFMPSTGDIVAGSVMNTNEVTDILISRGADDLQLGDPEDDEKSEIVETMSSRDGFVLVAGTISEDSTLAADLCGAACSGDLQESDLSCPFGADRDGFWLLLDPDDNAVGRSFGDCSRQSVVASQLGSDAITLSIELEGEMTLDLLSGPPRKIETGELERLSLIAHLPRPAAP